MLKIATLFRMFAFPWLMFTAFTLVSFLYFLAFLRATASTGRYC